MLMVGFQGGKAKFVDLGQIKNELFLRHRSICFKSPALLFFYCLLLSKNKN